MPLPGGKVIFTSVSMVFKQNKRLQFMEGTMKCDFCSKKSISNRIRNTDDVNVGLDENDHKIAMKNIFKKKIFSKLE